MPDEILQRLKQHLTPPQIVELACVVGFWKFYNTVHDSLHIPVESQLLNDTGYVDLRVRGVAPRRARTRRPTCRRPCRARRCSTAARTGASASWSTIS